MNHGHQAHHVVGCSYSLQVCIYRLLETEIRTHTIFHSGTYTNFHLLKWMHPQMHSCSTERQSFDETGHCARCNYRVRCLWAYVAVFLIHLSLLIHLFFPAIFSRPSEDSTPVVMPTDQRALAWSQQQTLGVHACARDLLSVCVCVCMHLLCGVAGSDMHSDTHELNIINCVFTQSYTQCLNKKLFIIQSITHHVVI